MSYTALSASDFIRAGFNNSAQGLQDFEGLRWIVDSARHTGLKPAWSADDVFSILSSVDVPDTALWHVRDIARKALESRTTRIWKASNNQLARLLHVCGASEYLGRMLSNQPEFVEDVLALDGNSVEFTCDDCADYIQQVQNFRTVYWRNLLRIVADDVTSSNPLEVQPGISKRLSTLIDTALQTALHIAQNKVPGGKNCKFAVFAMGKLGAQEINYISDVDLVYLVDKTEDFHGDLTVIGTHIGATLQAVCSSVINGVTAPALWDIDTALRPEGKAGALVRTVQSCKSYYKQWAQNWEFQALLKARFVAGDSDVAQDFLNLITPLLWNASARKNFVYDCRAMRKRVEDLIPLDQKDREIKLGKGGLRDVEFTVQMLQLVHGRTDESLRTKSTLESLSLLSYGGYVSRSQAADLSEDYRFLRVLEHRQQLWTMRRTHLFPKISNTNDDIFARTRQINVMDIESNADLRRLARAVGMTPVTLVNRFDEVRRQVRQLHMDIYYRPMLPNISQMSDDDIALSEQAMFDRFESIGFADPHAAMGHVHSLTAGVSRASRINRILLPTILSWLGNGQNPDMGLIMWRRWVENFGSSGPYLGFLRDSPTALQRLCHVLSNSRYLGDTLLKSSESTTWLGNDESLRPRSLESLHTRSDVILSRFKDSQIEFSTLLRALRRREIERVGLGWMSGVISSHDALDAMTRVYDVVLDTALSWAQSFLCKEEGITVEDAPAHLAAIAMGRYGGQEVNFSSDADVMLVYEPHRNADDTHARAFAISLVNVVREILTGIAGTEQKLDIDMDLRPEGKNGPLVRSVESYREYYAHWAQTWERQALLRARFCAGDKTLGESFLSEVIDPIRYAAATLTATQVHDIQKLKARMESERLPRGVRYDRHIKLGRGGLSDVEWTIQLFQLEHAHEWEDLRTTHTLDALNCLEKHGVFSTEDANVLRHNWILCTDMRNANFLWNGRTAQADIIPDDSFDMGGLSACLGLGAHRGQQFMDEVLASMRKCRDIVDRVFYGYKKDQK